MPCLLLFFFLYIYNTCIIWMSTNPVVLCWSLCSEDIFLVPPHQTKDKGSTQLLKMGNSEILEDKYGHCDSDHNKLSCGLGNMSLTLHQYALIARKCEFYLLLYQCGTIALEWKMRDMSRMLDRPACSLLQALKIKFVCSFYTRLECTGYFQLFCSSVQ